MRITNVNTLSSLLDRLIVERIKWYFFVKGDDMSLVVHQQEIIDLIKLEIEKILLEPEYEYLSEKRTFVNEILVNLDELIKNNCHIGESDRKRLEETKKENPDVNVFIQQERRLRTANEGRSKNKNLIDQNFKKLKNEV